MTNGQRFDAAYYRTFYGSRVAHDRTRIGHLANGVVSLAASWQLSIRSVLDVGAGKGYWRDWFVKHRPHVHYHGIDVSEHAARRYGHEQADLATWTPRRRYDLVICQSMLQYLDDDEAIAAIAVLWRACNGLMFLEAPTRHDVESVIDTNASDLDGTFREGSWYRARLDPLFMEIGAGLWATRQLEIPLFELERTRAV